MTAQIINLKQARKQRARLEKQKSAAASREKFGRTKGQKNREKLTSEKSVSHLDAHRLDKDSDD